VCWFGKTVRPTTAACLCVKKPEYASRKEVLCDELSDKMGMIQEVCVCVIPCLCPTGPHTTPLSSPAHVQKSRDGNPKSMEKGLELCLYLFCWVNLGQKGK